LSQALMWADEAGGVVMFRFFFKTRRVLVLRSLAAAYCMVRSDETASTRG